MMQRMQRSNPMMIPGAHCPQIIPVWPLIWKISGKIYELNVELCSWKSEAFQKINVPLPHLFQVSKVQGSIGCRATWIPAKQSSSVLRKGLNGPHWKEIEMGNG
ncbi:hypothetical protein ASG86_17635 [Arthrobacter sp. Soil764]|nr:hypothetical protein ASG86_17635 [Arthrobacter sp. Soil764]